MYVFHSFMRDQLRDSDLKAKVLDHLRSPVAIDRPDIRNLRELCQSSFEQSVFDAGLIRLGVQAAKFDRDMATATRDAARQDLAWAKASSGPHVSMVLRHQKTAVVDSPAGERQIHATVSTGGSFGASSLQQEIGLGDARSIRAVAVTWPRTGRVQTFTGVGMDQVLHIREGAPEPARVELGRIDLSPATLANRSPRHRH